MKEIDTAKRKDTCIKDLFKANFQILKSLKSHFYCEF